MKFGTDVKPLRIVNVVLQVVFVYVMVKIHATTWRFHELYTE
jgi:hypothetical protein